MKQTRPTYTLFSEIGLLMAEDLKLKTVKYDVWQSNLCFSNVRF